MTKIQKIAFLAVLFCIILPVSGAFGLTNILNVRHWAAPDYTRVVIDTSDDAQFKVTTTAQKISIDFKKTAFPKTIPHQFILNKPGISKVLVMPLPHRAVRVELWLAGNVETTVFNLKKFLDKPARVVIDIRLPDMEKKESEERKQFKVSKKDEVIVVIDAGHGGGDPGAVGRRGTREKTVVLKIARRLRNILNKKEGYQAFLTRNGDYYVSFKKRLKIAREYGADLFISIHADGCKDRRAKGSSVYCLSTRRASSEAARLLARRENLSDIIAGSPNGQCNDESDPITLNMVQTETINLSKTIGSIILKDIKGVNRLKFHKVQAAPFMVLKLPEIPSILVETAYISNPKEERLLRSPQFQAKIARAIASSIFEFLPVSQTASTTRIAKKNAEKLPSVSTPRSPKSSIYIVKRGDTLEKIARRHNTTISALLRLNNMRLKDRIYVRQKLRVSVARQSGGPIYIVKRGDTLKKIARRHNTTISILLRLNNLRLRDRIYVRQKLRVPVARQSGGPVYIVKRGDTLEKIARRHNTTISTLLRLNNMRLKDRIYARQRLKIPG
ncbi:MAG: N-acetylmuramoyl-L-alanine amidase [Proteobacteria bacterium]|nr:N-acetylmuramoyl-L-alanine amidase [Pseudomonadota bacterium]